MWRFCIISIYSSVNFKHHDKLFYMNSSFCNISSPFACIGWFSDDGVKHLLWVEWESGVLGSDLISDTWFFFCMRHLYTEPAASLPYSLSCWLSMKYCYTILFVHSIKKQNFAFNLANFQITWHSRKCLCYQCGRISGK